jgi:tetratricopeptide (TPR) repeat protein
MIEELLRRGRACEAAGDFAGAEAAYREADELDDAEGAILLGLILKRRDEFSGARDAFLRAEARGHREAGSCLGNMLWDNGDLEGAKSAYERAIAAGSSDAVLNLGLMLAQQGVVDEALRYLRAAESTGDAAASGVIGRLLEAQDDLQGAAAAYRQGAAGGDARAAYDLGAVLTKLEDRDGARAAFQRAHELGHEGADKALVVLEAQETARTSMQEGVEWAHRYVAACDEVLSAANACLKVANTAVGARNMAAQRPQHEISVENFRRFAEEAERDFAPLYQRFVQASAAARETADRFLASQLDPVYAEMILIANVQQDVLDNVATAKAILSTNYGPTPAAFVQAVEELNRLALAGGAVAGSEGNIYRPPAAIPSDERTCPWCAETIKAAAVICRFCGRDVPPQPDAG